MEHVATYQQTFISAAGVTEQQCRFNQVYKNQGEVLQVKVTSIASFSDSSKTTYMPTLFFAEGLGEISGKSSVTDAQQGTTNNRFFLGVTGAGSHDTEAATEGHCDITTTSHISFMCDDLPLSNFLIKAQGFGGGASVSQSFLVNFQIEVFKRV